MRFVQKRPDTRPPELGVVSSRGFEVKVLEFDDRFTCEQCGDMIRASDYDWKIRGLFYDLKKTGICERCHQDGYNEL